MLTSSFIDKLNCQLRPTYVYSKYTINCSDFNSFIAYQATTYIERHPLPPHVLGPWVVDPGSSFLGGLGPGLAAVNAVIHLARLKYIRFIRPMNDKKVLDSVIGSDTSLWLFCSVRLTVGLSVVLSGIIYVLVS